MLNSFKFNIIDHKYLYFDFLEVKLQNDLTIKINNDLKKTIKIEIDAKFCEESDDDFDEKFKYEIFFNKNK
jgi:hypothetical protein